jgi:hypothetical protein
VDSFTFFTQEFKVHVAFVSREKDVPRNFFRGQNIDTPACVLQWSPGTTQWIVNEPNKYK